MAKVLLKILDILAFISLVEAMYYCTHFLYESGQDLCPPSEPPLTYYAAVHLCCKDDSNFGSAIIYRTFETEPPKTFPLGCTPALQDANIGKFICKSGEDAYSNWDPTFADVIPVCCPSSSAPMQGLKVATAHLGSNGQVPQPGGTAGGTSIDPQPIWPWSASNWGTGGVSRWASYTSGSSLLHSNHIGGGRGCGDLIPPIGSGQPNCPTKVGLGLCQMQFAQMATDCPLSCGCRDWIAPSGTMSCADKLLKNYCQLYTNRMQIQCPVACGFC